MKKEIKYTSDGKYSVYCGKKEIARSYIGDDTMFSKGGYEVRILQGMPREETRDKIIRDCPDFAKANDMNPNIVLKLFCK